MPINEVNSNTNLYELNVNKTIAQNKVSAAVQDSSAEEVGEAYVVEKTQSYSIDIDKVNSMKADFQEKYQLYQQMIVTLFQNMGKSVDGSLFDLMNSDAVTNLRDKIAALDVDDATKAQAQALVAEDGYFGVEQTATRILDFAQALSGGDLSKMETLRNAVQAGFDQAKQVWGGELPDICQQTYDKVMAGFASWEKSALGENPVSVEA